MSHTVRFMNNAVVPGTGPLDRLLLAEVDDIPVPREGELVTLWADDESEKASYVVSEVQWSLGGPTGLYIAWVNLTKVNYG